MRSKRTAGYYNKVARLKSGRVAKFFPEKVSEKEAKQVAKLHRNYVELLRQAGVRVAETDLAIKNLWNNQARLRILQEGFPDAEIARHRLRHCSPEEARAIAEAIFKETCKVLNFNRKVSVPKYGMIVGADFKPDNVAVVNGDVVYIDTFSPHLRSVREPKRLHPVFERYFDRQGRVLGWATKNFLTEIVYNPKKRFITLVSLMSRLRPELRRDFLRIARKTARNELPKKEAEEIARGLSTGNLVLSSAFGTAVHLLGKRKGKNIQV